MKLICKIEDFFNFIQYKNNIEIKENELFNISNLEIYTKNENNKKIKINSIIRKKDTITELKTKNISLKVANKHLISYDGKNCKNVKDIEINDKIFVKDNSEAITEINRFKNIENVYDISVDSETHLFQTADGVIHHNTSSLQTVMSLLKKTIVTIEAPHTNEDNIINIPYLVRKGSKVESKESAFKEVQENDFEVVNAESNLITDLRNKKPMTDAQYNQFLKNHKLLQPIADKFKSAIEATAKYDTVLFLDEFYRCFDYNQEVEVEVLDEQFKKFISENI